MNTILYETAETVVNPPQGMFELVRGNDLRMIDRIAPMLRKQSVLLDLRDIERIDAAGIAALISLYGSAHKAGHEFKVCNVATRVAEILKLVGLDHILVNRDILFAAPAASRHGRPAA